MPSSKKKTFWGKGFEILQNIENRSALQKLVKHARDPISMVTINKKPDEANKNQRDFSDIDQVADILEMGLQLRWVIYSIYFKIRKKFYTKCFCEPYCFVDNGYSSDEKWHGNWLNKHLGWIFTQWKYQQMWFCTEPSDTCKTIVKQLCDAATRTK